MEKRKNRLGTLGDLAGRSLSISVLSRGADARSAENTYSSRPSYQREGASVMETKRTRGIRRICVHFSPDVRVNGEQYRSVGGEESLSGSAAAAAAAASCFRERPRFNFYLVTRPRSRVYVYVCVTFAKRDDRYRFGSTARVTNKCTYVFDTAVSQPSCRRSRRYISIENARASTDKAAYLQGGFRANSDRLEIFVSTFANIARMKGPRGIPRRSAGRGKKKATGQKKEKKRER